MRSTAPLGHSKVRTVPVVELVVQSGLEKGKSARSQSQALVIGSARDCDLVLEDSTVSARHCEVSLSPDGILVRDLGSKNGVRVGAVWLREGHVDPGTQLTVGETEVLLHSPGRMQLTLSTSGTFGPLQGDGVAMRVLFADLAGMARSSSPVLVEGESGTGKTLTARALHEASRRKGPLLQFDCGSVPPSALEQELFGPSPAPSFEGLLRAADGGTLVLEEVGELALPAQARLAAFLERREDERTRPKEDPDTRVIACVGTSLRGPVKDKKFRQDLYLRLLGLRVVVPPLRQRLEDLPALVDAFLEERASALRWATLPENTRAMLRSHRWPGNVREVRNVVARLSALGQEPGQPLVDDDGELPFQGGNPDAFLPLSAAREAATERFERKYLEVLLHKSRGGVSEGARLAQVSRQFLQRLMKKHQVR